MDLRLKKINKLEPNSFYLQEYAREIVKNGLQQLETKCPRHLCHAHQPVGGISVHQLAQVLQEGCTAAFKTMQRCPAHITVAETVH